MAIRGLAMQIEKYIDRLNSLIEAAQSHAAGGLDPGRGNCLRHGA
jgi:hypothetical protein